MQARVRPATQDDAQQVEALAESAGLRVDVQRELSLPQSRLFVSEQGSAVVAACSAWRLADELEVLDLVVNPGLRRKGVARQLVEFLLSHEANAGARSVFLEVRADNAAAHALYASLGFDAFGVRQRYYSDGADALLLRRGLP